MVTVVPVVVALISYYIQNYKFIVNEEYYDKMILEISKRKKKLNKQDTKIILGIFFEHII